MKRLRPFEGVSRGSFVELTVSQAWKLRSAQHICLKVYDWHALHWSLTAFEAQRWGEMAEALPLADVVVECARSDRSQAMS